MVRDLVLQLLIFSIALGSFPVAHAGPDSGDAQTPADASTVQKLEAGLPVAGGETRLVAIEVQSPSELPGAVEAVERRLHEMQAAAGTTVHPIDEANVVTSDGGPDPALDGKLSVARSRFGSNFHFIRHRFDQFLSWSPTRFRVTVIGVMAFVVGGSSWLQLTLSPNPLEAAVAHWIGMTTGGIILWVEWQNLRLKNFVMREKRSLLRILIDKVLRRSEESASQPGLNSIAQMFSKNTEVNLWLFSVFKFIFLATLGVQEFGPKGAIIWPLHLTWTEGLGSVFSILGTSLGGTLVSFPTTRAIYSIHDEGLEKANGEPGKELRANNQFQLMTSGALALRALFVIMIILGVHDIAEPNSGWAPSLAISGGVGGMVTMMGLSLARLRSVARAVRSTAGPETPSCALDVGTNHGN